MFNYYFALFVTLSVTARLVSCKDYYVSITNNGPVVLGANITFTAILTPDDGSKSQYFWEDNGIPQHTELFESESTVSTWTTSYPSNLYPPGIYEVQVDIKKSWSFIWYHVTSARAHFNLTYLLNGKMELQQNHSVVEGTYVSSFSPLVTNLKLSQPDYEYITEKATSITVYWFIDCNLWGQTDNFTLVQEFKNATETHEIEAVIVASYEPIPPPTTTTTTTTTTTPKPTTSTSTQKPTTSTQKPTTTQKPAATTLKSDVSSHSSVNSSEKAHIVKRHTAKNHVELGGYKGLHTHFSQLLPVCMNQTTIPMDPNKTYGYFHRKVIVQDPVSSLTINGNNWLQHKDMLMLQVKCKGTPPFQYCMQFKLGEYNVTGKETCRNPITTETCDFPVVHYFSNADIHSVVIIVSNNVHKNVSRVVVRFYEVTTKAQLSVIVVPVSFSIIAVILIVFGVAYYIQNRSRFTVEVADFNFGQQYTDLEYKTFMERLRESFNNALNWGTTRETDSPSSVPPWTSTDNNKYGTMT